MLLGCRAVATLVRGRAAQQRSTLRTASQGRTASKASQGRRPRSPTRPPRLTGASPLATRPPRLAGSSPKRPPRLIGAPPLAKAAPRKRAPRLASASALQPAGRPAKLKKVGLVARAVVRLPPIDQLRSVGEVLAAHEEHRKRYKPLELSETWLALGQIVGHDQLEQQQLRRCPTVLEALTAHTLQAVEHLARTLPLARTLALASTLRTPCRRRTRCSPATCHARRSVWPSCSACRTTRCGVPPPRCMPHGAPTPDWQTPGRSASHTFEPRLGQVVVPRCARS